MGSQDRLAASGLEENQPDDETVSGCFDFRLRTRSFDLHQIAHHRRLKKLGFHLRAGSDSDIGTDVKTPSTKSSKSNPQLSSKSRHFVRVIRDSRNPDLENPHVVHRFSQNYVQQLNVERADSISEGVRPLPYLVTGHTILKKQATVEKSELDLPESPSVYKHAKFFDEVVVIEFDKKCTIGKDLHVTRKEKLHDENDGATENPVVSEMIIQADYHDNHLNTKETEIPAKGDDQTSADNKVFLPSESTYT